jgi:hypothetical protein
MRWLSGSLSGCVVGWLWICAWRWYPDGGGDETTKPVATTGQTSPVLLSHFAYLVKHTKTEGVSPFVEVSHTRTLTLLGASSHQHTSAPRHPTNQPASQPAQPTSQSTCHSFSHKCRSKCRQQRALCCVGSQERTQLAVYERTEAHHQPSNQSQKQSIDRRRWPTTPTYTTKQLPSQPPSFTDTLVCV